MLKLTTVVLLSISLGCGGGQKSDSQPGQTTEHAPLPDSDAPAPAAAAEMEAPATGSPEDINAGKADPTPEQVALMKEAETDLAGIVDEICACSDKACLDGIVQKMMVMSEKYRGLEEVRVPQETLDKMMELGQRAGECQQKVMSGS